MRALATVLLTVLFGAALGLGGAWLALHRSGSLASVTHDGWTAAPSVGSSDADLFTRAMTAKAGLLALPRSEAVYFSRAVDEAGRPLREACVYEFAGGPQKARWWSITAYASDNFLPRNEDRALSVSSAALPAAAWRAVLSPAPVADAPWISSRNAGEGLVLMLRLYHPAADVLANPAGAGLPRIRTVSCADAPA